MKTDAPVSHYLKDEIVSCEWLGKLRSICEAEDCSFTLEGWWLMAGFIPTNVG